MLMPIVFCKETIAESAIMSNVPPPPVFHNKPLPVHDEDTEAILVAEKPAPSVEPVAPAPVTDENKETNFDSDVEQHAGFHVEEHTKPVHVDTVEVVRQPVSKKDLKDDDSPFTTVVVKQSKKGLVLRVVFASILLAGVITLGTLVLTNVLPLFS